MKRLRGTGSLYKRGRVYWAAYYHNNVQVRESTHKATKEEAKGWLDNKMRELQTGEYDPSQKDITVADLMASVLADYETNGKKSIDDAKARWTKHLEPAFGHYHVLKVTTDAVRVYTTKRQEEKAADATINRELALLKRAYSLGRQSTPPKVRIIPYIPMLREDNVRTGFLEPAQYDALAAATAKRGVWLRALFECGYTWGWRSGELLGMKVKQIDLLEGIARLLPGTTKNRLGRQVAFTPAVSRGYYDNRGQLCTAIDEDGGRQHNGKLAKLLAACCAGKTGEQYVFTKGKKRVRDFRGAWEESCKEAGVPDLLFHDLRRTAVRNMVRAGVNETVAMQISGHKTRAVFDRYNIVSEADLKAAMQKLENSTLEQSQLHAQRQSEDRHQA